MDRVFICYSRKDSEFVDTLVHDLNMAGVKTWYDVNDISRDKLSHSQSWRRAVDRALRECTQMIVVLSPNSVESSEVEAEWNYFLSQRRSIFPVLYRDCDIPYRLYALNYLDFRHEYAPAFDDLIALLPYSAIPPSYAPHAETREYDPPPAYAERSPERTPDAWRSIPKWTWIVGGVASLLLLALAAMIINGWRSGNGAEGTPTHTGEAPTQATASTLDAGLPTDPPTSTITETPPLTATDEPTGVVAPTPFGGGTGRIAFTSERDGNREIYVMDADGQNPVNLTSHPEIDTNPVWSPDGSRIAFTSQRDGNEEIYVMNADGSGGLNLTNHLEADYSPTWSPDGLRIAFGSKRDGSYYLYVMGADGSNPTRITAGEDSTLTEWNPVWSPDGTRIAFVTDRDGNREIYVMDANGTNAVNLTNSVALEDHPTWSPDGTQIAFVSNRDGNSEIYMMTADGSGQINLTNSPFSDVAPAWSPDGSRIAFTSDRDGNTEIYVMDVDGANPTRLTINEVSDDFPAWQPALIPDTSPTPLLSLIVDFASYLLPSD